MVVLSLLSAGSDYNTTTATVVFSRTVGEFLLSIPILTDAVLESTEEFTATLSSSDTDVLFNLTSTTILIVDIDGNLPLNFGLCLLNRSQVDGLN